MMIGCCAQLDDYITVKDQQYDYIELSAMELMTHDDQSFREFLALFRNTGLPCRGFNSFCGADLPIVGPDVNLLSLKEYMDRLCGRGAELEIRSIGIGAPFARRPPADWPAERSDGQMLEFMEMACAAAKPYGIAVLLEAVNDYDCGYLHTTDHALSLFRELKAENSGLVLDYYQARLMGENWKALGFAMPAVRHVHVSGGERGTPRTFYAPGTDDAELRGIFDCLTSQGYGGDTVSVEADRRLLARDGAACAKTMREIWNEKEPTVHNDDRMDSQRGGA